MRSILNWVRKHRIEVYVVLGLPLLAMVLYQFVHYHVIPLRYISWSRIHLIGVPLLEALLLFGLFDFHERSEHKGRPSGWEYILVFSAVNLVLVFLLTEYYTFRSAPEVASITLVLALAPSIKILLVLLTVLSFLMGFQARFTEISLAVIPESAPHGSVHGNAWIDRKTALILLVLFIVGLGVRLYNLDGFPPHVDEYAHSEQALSMLAGNPGTYTRSLVTVTVPIYLSFKTLGVSLWAGRLPLVLLNMLGMIPLFFLGRRFHNSIGLICAALYVSSPWMIATSRTMREYAVHPLFSYTVILLLLDLLHWDGMTVSVFLRKNKYRILALVLIFGYLAFDSKSTLKGSFLLYGVFGVLAVIKAVKLKLPIRTIMPALALMIGILLIVLWTQPLFYTRHFKNALIYTPSYWKMIIFSNSHHGYVINSLVYLILFLILVLTVRAVIGKYTKLNFTLLFIVMAFSANLIYLTYFLARPGLPARSRYGLLAECWYLPLIAIAVWYLSRFLLQAFKGLSPTVVVILMGVVFVNPLSIQNIITYDGGGAAPVTGNPHYITAPARDYLAGAITAHDILISDLVFKYDNITGSKLRTQENIRYSVYLASADTDDKETVIEKYPRGWVAVSPNVRPETDGFQFSDFTMNGKQLHYIGQIGDIYIWNWSE